MNVLERLDELLADVQAAVDASDLTDKASVTVTDDGKKVETARSPRAGAIVIYPFPAETRPAPKVSRLTWTIAVAVDEADPRKAATRAQELLAVLRTAGVLRADDTANPTDFEKADRSSTIPGYTITHIEEHRS